MNKRFTKLIAALALLVFMTPSLAGWGQTREEVADVLVATSFAATSTTYTDFSDVTFTSDAVYAGNSAKTNNGGIQLRSKNSNSGIVSTTSGGTIHSVSITVETGSNTLDIYGKNTAYTSASDLYSNQTQGTKIGSISATGTVDLGTNVDQYAYIGIRSNNGAIYLTDITVTWTTSGGTPTPTCATPTFSLEAGTYSEAQTVSITCETEGATVYYTTDGENPTASSSVYSAPLTIEQTTTVKAIAMKEGYNNSAVATAVYTIAQEQTFNKIAGHNPVAGQTYLIVDLTSGRALTSANGPSSAPTAVAVTINDNDQITTAESALQWTFEAVEGGYVIHPVGNNANWLYSTDGNNGVRVGTNENKIWTLDVTDATNTDYHGFKHNGTSRYIGVYSSSDWRAYTSVNNNIKDTNIALFVLGEAPNDPVISASNVSIEYDATEGEITYAVENPVDDATVVATTTAEWLTIGTIGETVPFTCSSNTETSARTATVTLNYVKNGETLATKDVTVTQAAAPVVYTTIPSLFEAATSTATDVIITFGSWVISAVHNSNAYLTDNQGHGLIIYASNHGFQVNDVLTGTVSCKLQTYRGSAELTNLTSSTEGLSVVKNGTVAEQDIAINTLGGVNTGALLAYQGLTYNGTSLVDGNNNTITPYSTLYSYTFEAGKTYNVKGIYLQYNDTKEILPRSSADIEEVQVQHDEYTLTIGNPDNITITANYDEEVLTNGEEAEILDGTKVTFVVNVAMGYVLESVTVIDANQEAVTFTETSGVYTFNMPAVDVTINATAEEYVAPTPSNYVRISSLDDLTDGSVVIIAARHNSTADSYYAMKNATSGKPEGTLFTSATSEVGETVASTITDNEENYYWTVNVVDGGYTFTNAFDNKIGYSGSGTDFQNDGDKTTWTIEKLTAGDKAMVPEYEGFVIKNGTTTTRAFAFNGSAFGAYATTNMNASGYNFFLDFFVQASTPVTETFTKHITGYTNNGGYYLIASPIGTVNPIEVTNMITPNDSDNNRTYDLYRFDQNPSDGLEWRNYRQGAFNLNIGQGYLYAHRTDVDLVFTGSAISGSTYDVPLTKSASASGHEFPDWNLVGNPFADVAHIDGGHPFYTLDVSGAYTLVSEGSQNIENMQGVFVVAGENEESITFVKGESSKKSPKVTLNVSKGTEAGVIDRAIVCFGETRQMPKFQLFKNSTKVYIPMEGKDYALVRGEEMGAMPVNFKAEENGTYSMNFSCENVGFAYLHLIDNKTGNDIDLLKTPSYSFEAKTTDYESRFKLVFATGDNSNDDNFAFFSNGSFVINNEGNAELQVIDITGRIVKSESVNGCTNVNVNAAPGVYMLRLINGDNVKVQKVVVK